MKPRWLRHRIATPSPGLEPLARSAWASALVRRSRSGHVSVPELVDERRAVGVADRGGDVAPAASVGPQRCSASAVRASLSGAVGRMMPVPARMRGSGVVRELLDGVHGRSPTTCAADPDAASGQPQAVGELAALDERVDVAGPPRVEEDVALADARLLGQQARVEQRLADLLGQARGRCRRSRARGARTRCGSRPTSPCRPGAGGSAGPRGGPDRGRRAGGPAARVAPTRPRTAPRAPRPRAGRRGGRRAGPRGPAMSSGWPAPIGARRSAASASTWPGKRERAGAQAVDAGDLVLEGERGQLGSPAPSRRRARALAPRAPAVSAAAAPEASTSAPTVAAATSQLALVPRGASARSAGVEREDGQQAPGAPAAAGAAATATVTGALVAAAR